MKLSTKTSLAVIFMGVITVVFSSLFINEIIGTELQNSTSLHQLEESKQTMDKIDRLLYERYLDIQGISEENLLENFLNDDVSSSTQGTDDLTERLTELTTFSGPWDVLLLTDKNGQIVGSTEESIINRSILSWPESLIAYESSINNTVYYSDLIYSELSHSHTIIFAVPIHNNHTPGKPIVGTLMGFYSWQIIIELIEETKAYHAHLYNRDGFMIGSNFNQDHKILESDQNHVKSVKHAIANLSMSMIALDNETGTTDMLTSSSRSTGYLDYQGNDWTVLIETPAEIVFAPVRSTILKLSLFFVPLIFLISASMLFFIRIIITKPIQKLTQSTQAIAAGDISSTVDIRSNDELGILAQNFNTMTSKLKTLYGSLEDKVRSKTKELEDTLNKYSKSNKFLEKSKMATLNVLEDMEIEKEKLVREKNKIDTIIHSIGDGLFVIDNDNKIVLFNKIASNMTGYNQKQAIGKNYEEILKFSLENRKKTSKKTINELLFAGKTSETNEHINLINRKKEKIPVMISSATLKNNQGKVIGLVIVFRDVSKEREIDQAKSEFVSLASHQLRTPLSSINWYSEMLLNGDAGKLNKEQKNFIEEIVHGNQIMIGLVNALLNVSRIEMGTFTVDPEVIDLTVIAEDVLSELKPLIESKGQTIERKYGKDLSRINADPKLMRIIFQNLLSNAVKYTPRKGRIKISIHEKKPYLEIQVADTGYGIPKKERKKIFTKLYRASNIQSKDTEGTGLGLYIVKSIIEQSKGKITFSSEENKGSTFTVKIPLKGMKKKKGPKELS